VSTNEIVKQLERIAAAEDFPHEAALLAEQWERSPCDNLDTVEEILRFMEQHTSINLGAPGPLVHFVERFHGNGYESRLLDSVRRKPVAHTVTMLNRLINGTSAPQARRLLIAALEQAKAHPSADSNTQYLVDHYLRRLSGI
jgi:hypothetical protein